MEVTKAKVISLILMQSFVWFAWPVEIGSGPDVFSP